MILDVEKLLSEFQITDYGYTEDPKPISVDHYNRWLEGNQHLPLEYLAGERAEKRQNILNHWKDFQSALVFIFSYDDIRQNLKKFYQDDPNWNGLKLASYTLGFDGYDYHDELRKTLDNIGRKLAQVYGVQFKLTLDTHPVLERDLAYKAGLGWFGKNSMMINRSEGSFFIIGSLLLDKKLNVEIKSLETDHCGQCNLCTEACPTEAIDPVTRTIKASACISTFTIEQFKLDTIAPDVMDLSSGFIFGCDICQDVCPWNKKLERQKPLENYTWTDGQNEILNFYLKKPITDLSDQLEKMSGKQFEKKFKKTSFERSGRRGLLKNVRFFLKHSS